MSQPNASTSQTYASQDAILAELRRRIVRGQYQPGSRLPTRSELEEQFSASRVTIQRVFDRLTDEGFARPAGRNGTFVQNHPPHLSRYALVFPRSRSSAMPWPHFWNALINESASFEGEGDRRIIAYYGVGSHEDIDQYHQLVDAVRDHLLAGLIFAVHPAYLRGSPVLEEGDIPRVAVMNHGDFDKVHAVELNSQSFMDRALDYLRSRGRRRLAVVLPSVIGGVLKKHEGELIRRASDYGMTLRPYWVQSVTQDSAANCMRLLMSELQSERPDALILSDDNIVEQATLGLSRTGVRLPDDLDVVAHANLPWPTPTHLPAVRLGFDAHRILQSCLDHIDARRRSLARPGFERIDAIFEHELSARHAGLPSTHATHGPSAAVLP